jgi:hypothetical protein
VCFLSFLFLLFCLFSLIGFNYRGAQGRALQQRVGIYVELVSRRPLWGFFVFPFNKTYINYMIETLKKMAKKMISYLDSNYGTFVSEIAIRFLRDYMDDLLQFRNRRINYTSHSS